PAQHFALGIVGVGDFTQPGDRVVGLARAQQTASDLGRFAETQRQQAGGQGVEAAGMAALLGGEQAPRPLQRLAGTGALGLVEQQDAVELAEAAALAQFCGSSGPGAWSRSRASILSPRSIESS